MGKINIYSNEPKELVDPETGEIFLAKPKIAEREIPEDLGYLDLYGSLYTYALEVIYKIKPASTSAIFLALCRRVSFSDGSNTIDVRIDDLIDDLDLSKTVIYDSLEKLKRTHIIVKIDGVFYMNPYIFFRGTKLQRQRLIDRYGAETWNLSVQPTMFN